MAVSLDKKHISMDKTKGAPPAKKKKVQMTLKTKASPKKPVPKKSATKKRIIITEKTMKSNVKTSTLKKINSTKLKNVLKNSSNKTVKMHTNIKTSKSSAKSTSLNKKTTKASLVKTSPEKKFDGKTNKNEVNKINFIKAKLDKAKTLRVKAKTVAAKAQKLKVARALSKFKKQKTLHQTKVRNKTKPTLKKEIIKTIELKKAVVAKDDEKLNRTSNTKINLPAKAAAKKPKNSVLESLKRKNLDEPEDIPRKKYVLPNKKYVDFEIDVPCKRIIKPNKKYADFETSTTAKNVSELRTFIQDKKKSALKTDEGKKPILTPEVSMSDKPISVSSIKVIKPSDMKPAEKLLKKKKLEKEARAVSAPQSSEKREKAKIKITNVVTYNKSSLSSEEVNDNTVDKKTTQRFQPKESQVIHKPRADTNTTLNVKSVYKESAVQQVTIAQKASQVPSKVLKPKKIKELNRELRPIQAKFVAKYNVKQPDDNATSMCWITGIAVFPSGEVITVDMANRKIKLFSKEFVFLSQIKLDAIPQDISVSPINASNAYFSKPFSKDGIQKICMCDGKITLGDSFLTNGTNRGIVCTKAGILTSVQDGRYHDLDINHFKIDLLDYEGNLLQSVSGDPTGSRLFKLPLYFTVDNTGKQIIVSDCIKNCSYIISVDMTGKIQFRYEGINNNPITPRGLASDDENNIYVTEWEKHNVYILSPNGKRLQVLFTRMELLEQGIEGGIVKPYQLCVFKQGDKEALLLSEEGNNTIKLFHLLKKSEIASSSVLQHKTEAVDKAGVSPVHVPTDIRVKNPQTNADSIPAMKQIKVVKKGSSPMAVVHIEMTDRDKTIQSERRQAKDKSEQTYAMSKTEQLTVDAVDATRAQTNIKTDDHALVGPHELEAQIIVIKEDASIAEISGMDIDNVKKPVSQIHLAGEEQEPVNHSAENMPDTAHTFEKLSEQSLEMFVIPEFSQ